MNILDGISSVSPDEFSARVGSSLMIFQNALKPIIFPIVGISIIISIIMILSGTMFHSKTLKKVGIVDLGATAGALLLYFAVPLILGILKTMGNALN